MSTTWYDTVATLGWLAGITATDPAALPHLRARPPPPAPGGQGVRHPRHPVRRAGSSAGWAPATSPRSSTRWARTFDHRGPATDEAIVGAGRRPHRRVPRARRSPLAGIGPRAQAPAGAVARGRRSGSAAPRPPRCAGPPASRTAGCPSPSVPNAELLAELRTSARRVPGRCADRHRRPSPTSSTSDSHRPISSSRRARSPGRRTRSPSTCSRSRTPGSVRSRCASRPDRRRGAVRPDRRLRQ